MLIYAVCYSNYHPREVDSLWLHEADADARVGELDGDWRIYEMEVRESRLTQDSPDLGWVCGECEFTNLEVDTVCQLCTASRPKRVI